MDKLDWITFLAAIVIVIIMAVIINLPKMDLTKETTSKDLELYTQVDSCSDGSCCMPEIHYVYNTEPQTGPIRINYNYNLDDIYSPGATGYPRINFPDNIYNPSGNPVPADKNIYYSGITSIASSDIFSNNIWESGNITNFAYMSGSDSGFSEIFGVAYPLWRISSSMTPGGNFAYSSFTWILIDSSTGDIVTGGNVLPGNEVVKKVEIANKKYYFLIKTENVESFSLTLETPKISYDEAHLNPYILNLKNYLNTM